MTGELWHRPTRTELLIDKLREARAKGRALELRLGIAQHGARMKGIRDRGFRVINELESVYLLFDPERDGGHP